MSDQEITEKLEEIVERKVEKETREIREENQELRQKIEKLDNDTSKKLKNKNRGLTRREFLKKAGLATGGLAALMSPISALDVKSDSFNVYTGTGSEDLTEYLNIDNGVNVVNTDLSVDQDIVDGDGITIWDSGSGVVPSSQLAEHDNAAHSENYAVDGDTQPPENHDHAGDDLSPNSVETEEIDGNVVDRAEPITNLSGSIYLSSTEPSDMIDGDLWVDTS